MCSSTNRESSQTGLIKEYEYGRQEEYHKTSALLEFSAIDDIMAFKDAVEKGGHHVDEVGFWYGRRVGSKDMGYEERTPLMIAAMFGSKKVLSYILRTGCVDVNQKCGSDKATALHCAVAGGSEASLEVIKLLLDASADVGSLDARGNRSSDLILSESNNVFSSRKRILQAMLEGAHDNDEIYFHEAIGQREKQQENEVGTPRYPIDPSLPDINNGIYSTDEFRMFTFKVKPCSRAYSHDWTECPFVHPGENARRRDPRKYLYSCVPCPEFRKGSCSKGDCCEYAHGIFECWLHPAQYRTRLCKDELQCTRKVCFFAHKPEELRPLYASTGSALPSPNSYSPCPSPMDPSTLGSPSASTPPLTPPGASPPSMNGTLWHSRVNARAVPTLQIPRGKLNTRSNANGCDLKVELRGLENRLMQKLMMEEMPGLSYSKPNTSSFPISLSENRWELNRHAGVKPTTNLEDIFGSQKNSPSAIQMQQNANQQLWGFSSDISASNVIGSPPLRVCPSGTAMMDPRFAANSKQSQSFIESSANSELPSPVMEATTLSGWASPDGKLDWAIRGEELNKMKNSYSFAFRNSSSSSSPMDKTALLSSVDEDEPDVSWVNSLVKDAPTMESDQYCVEEQLQRRDGRGAVLTWPEQLYMEQEQVVA